MLKENQRVFVLGIDGATLDLLIPYIKNGKLPNFKKLLEKSSYNGLESVILPISAAAWTSMFTGKNPGKHGIYDFSRLDKNYEIELISSADRLCPALWNILSFSKKDVAVIGVPITFPAENINGIMVSGRGSPLKNDQFVSPRELLYNYPAIFKNYKLYPEEPFSNRNAERFFDNAYASENGIHKTVKWIYGLKKWDLFIAVFSITDLIPTYFWHFIDEKHPAYVKNVNQKVKDAILSSYQLIDKCLGEYLAMIDKDTTLLIVSDHGIGALYKTFYLNNWLLKKKYMTLKRNPVTLLKRLLNCCGFTIENIYKLVTSLKIIKYPAGRFSEKSQRKLLRLFLGSSDINWNKTKAFSFGHFGQIYINRKIVPEIEVKNLCNRIIGELKNQMIPGTSESIVDKAYLKEEIYSGPAVDSAADINILLKRLEYQSSPILGFESNKMIGPSLRNTSGTHKMKGLFIAYGENIKPGNFSDKISLLDITPTILAILGIPIADDVDGKALYQIFADPDTIKKQTTFCNDEYYARLWSQEISEQKATKKSVNRQ